MDFSLFWRVHPQAGGSDYCWKHWWREFGRLWHLYKPLHWPVSHCTTLTYMSTIVSVLLNVRFGSAETNSSVSVSPHLSVSPRGQGESVALITQVDIQPESLLSGPRPGPAAPAGKPVAQRHGSAAPIGFWLGRWAAGRCRLTGFVHAFLPVLEGW